MKVLPTPTGPKMKAFWACSTKRSVNGHQDLPTDGQPDLPTDGQRFSPRTDAEAPQGRPRDLPADGHREQPRDGREISPRPPRAVSEHASSR